MNDEYFKDQVLQHVDTVRRTRLSDIDLYTRTVPSESGLGRIPRAIRLLVELEFTLRLLDAIEFKGYDYTRIVHRIHDLRPSELAGASQEAANGLEYVRKLNDMQDSIRKAMHEKELAALEVGSLL